MDVLMPQLGETVAEGKIIKWFKAVGDHVAVGDNLCEIETDKVTVEVPAIEAGTLQAINVDVGTVAPVGAIIAVLGNGAAPVATATKPAPSAGPSKPAKAAAPATAIQPAAQPSTQRRGPLDIYREVDTPSRNFGAARLTGGTAVTPLARRLASDGGIDLNRVAGSGPRGRIGRNDIVAAIAARPATPSAVVEPSAEAILAIYRDQPHSEAPLDGMRRTIARRLVEAKTTIPHFYLSGDVAVDRLSRLREEINAAAPKNPDGAPAYRLTLTDLIVKALALALQRVPRANAIWAGDRLLAFQRSDMAVAVSVPDGLFTPVIASADTMSLSAISAAVKDLAARARSRQLQPHEYQGGVTTISNLGMHGVRDFAAIVNPPQSTILAIGASRRDAVETENGGLAFLSRITATLSCDHRVVDGVVGAELLAAFSDLMQYPLQMMV